MSAWGLRGRAGAEGGAPSRARKLLGLAALAALGPGCDGCRSSHLAELAAASGGVERDRAGELNAWTQAEPGARFSMGDGVRTGKDGRAQLRLTRGSALDVSPSTLLRFLSGPPSETNLDVEFGDVVRVPGTASARNPVVAVIDGGVFTAWVSGADPSQVEARKWTTRDGKHTTEAELVDFEGGKVILKRDDGKVVSVSLDRLSLSDHLYVKEALAALGREMPAGTKPVPMTEAPEPKAAATTPATTAPAPPTAADLAPASTWKEPPCTFL